MTLPGRRTPYAWMQRAMTLPLLLAGLCIAGADSPDPLAPLYRSIYITARDIEADVPYGSFSIEEGVICFLPGQDRRKEGMFIGELDLTLSRLPREHASLNVFAKEALARGEHEPRYLSFDVTAAYLNASLESDSTVLPGGRAVAIREWEDLEEAEQQRFAALYQEGMERRRQVRSAQPDVSGPEPQGREFFASFWFEPEKARTGAAAAEQAAEEHYDMHVDQSGRHMKIADVSDGRQLFASEKPDS